MTLFPRLPGRLTAICSIALICTFPFVYAVELEGTVVAVNSSVPDQSRINAPVPAAPTQPDSAAPAAAPGVQDNPSWKQEWEIDLGKAFGGNHQNSSERNDGPNAPEVLIVFFSVVALIIVLCSPLILIGVFLVLRYKAKARHQQALNNNIDKLLAAGRDIPVELLRGDEPKSADDTGNQAKGIRNICLGAAWFVFLTIAWDIEVGAIGFIWVGLGLSQVLIWYLNRPKAMEQAGQQD